MKGFYIEITNNLLDPKHTKQMGIAVWEYMWCIDKMTSVSENGEGKVLGGKPIKAKEISEDIGHARNHVSEYLKKLEKFGYISLKRTPYGNVITVHKAKKRFGQKTRDVQNTDTEMSKNVTSGVQKRNIQMSKNVTNKEDKTVRQDSRHIASSSSPPPFSFKETLEDMKKGGKSNRTDLKIIALYWVAQNWEFENREQYEAQLKRDLRAAKSLKGYNSEQIKKAIKYCKDNYSDVGWTLETVSKRIAHVANKK